MRGAGALVRTAWGATALYTVVAVALTWPLAPRAARDVPGDLLDPLFSVWALGWDFHAFGLSPGGPPVTSLWDANIFHPVRGALARSEHLVPQAVLAAPVYLATRSLLVAYNVLFLATFVLSGTFMFLLARDETGDWRAALAAGLLYGFALFRWAEIEHIGALSSQWMPLALLLARRVARASGRAAPGWIAALGVVTAVQVTSSGYYLLFFSPFLLAWAIVEARRAGGRGPWMRLAAAGAVAAAVAAPLVLPLLALRAGGAHRDFASVVENSADLLSWVTAPETTRLWGSVLGAYPRGEARCFPGFVPLALGAIGIAGAVRAVGLSRRPPAEPTPSAVLTAVRAAVVVALVTAAVAAVAAIAGGAFAEIGPLRVRAVGTTRPALIGLAAVAAALWAWPRQRALLPALLARREMVSAALAIVAAWLSLGPLVTLRGWPVPIPSSYAVLYEYVPGFSSGRAPARFAMIAACFGALVAAWGVKHLASTRRGPRAAAVLCALFLVETAPVPLALSRAWPVEGVGALPEWSGGPSPIVDAVRALPDEAVLAALPFGEAFHETRAMFDSTFHWRRLLNGYSSWTPPEYAANARSFADPLRRAPAVVAAMRAAGATHVIVHEAAWMRGKGQRVAERLVAAGARPVARAGDVTLLALD